MRNALVDLLVAKRAVLGVDRRALRQRSDLCLGHVGAEQLLTEVEQRAAGEDVDAADCAFADEHTENEPAERDPHHAADVADEIRGDDRQKAPRGDDRGRAPLQRRAYARSFLRMLTLEILSEPQRPCEGVDARRRDDDAD